MKQVLTYGFAVLLLSACVQVKQQGLWEKPQEKPEPEHIENFYAIKILDEGMNSDVWVTPNSACVSAKNTVEHVYSGSNAIFIKWDKQGGGCSWVGMGVGWDAWSGKDMSMVIDKAAIQFKVYHPLTTFKSIPLAFGLEDYSGAQAWIGMSADFLEYKEGEKWGTVTLPLAKFAWDEFDADPSTMKQLIIQFEASGEMYFDACKIVPHEGGGVKHYDMHTVEKDAIVMDGNNSEAAWLAQEPIVLGKEHFVKFLYEDGFLHVSGTVVDDSPAQNSKDGDDIWNGDAVEIAFALTNDADKKRKRYLFTDQHLGIKMSDNPMVWDWQKHKKIEGAEVKIARTESGYTFEAKIPMSHFDYQSWEKEKPYGFEVALDLGNKSSRQTQLRWNSSHKEGFNTNPSLWGTMKIKAQEL